VTKPQGRPSPIVPVALKLLLKAGSEGVSVSEIAAAGGWSAKGCTGAVKRIRQTIGIRTIFCGYQQRRYVLAEAVDEKSQAVSTHRGRILRALDMAGDAGAFLVDMGGNKNSTCAQINRMRKSGDIFSMRWPGCNNLHRYFRTEAQMLAALDRIPKPEPKVQNVKAPKPKKPAIVAGNREWKPPAPKLDPVVTYLAGYKHTICPPFADSRFDVSGIKNGAISEDYIASRQGVVTCRPWALALVGAA
jgi:hypothetical protein